MIDTKEETVKAVTAKAKPEAAADSSRAERLQQEKAERDNEQQKKVDPGKQNKKKRQRIRVIADAKKGNPANDSNTLLSSSQRRAAVLSSLAARRTRMAPYERMKPLIAWEMFAAQYYSVQTPMVVD